LSVGLEDVCDSKLEQLVLACGMCLGYLRCRRVMVMERWMEGSRFAFCSWLSLLVTISVLYFIWLELVR